MLHKKDRKGPLWKMTEEHEGREARKEDEEKRGPEDKGG